MKIGLSVGELFLKVCGGNSTSHLYHAKVSENLYHARVNGLAVVRGRVDGLICDANMRCRAVTVCGIQIRNWMSESGNYVM